MIMQKVITKTMIKFIKKIPKWERLCLLGLLITILSVTALFFTYNLFILQIICGLGILIGPILAWYAISLVEDEEDI